ncbi:MAG: hypothetical protein J6B22_03650 [Clostridia bacterium]|nr:hypothetical protein [Clostridia bacterium]
MKRILSIVLTLALLLTALPLALSVSAAETTIVFKMGNDGTASHADGSTSTTYKEKVSDYELSISSGVQLYTGARDAKGNGCIRLGSSKNVGSFKFTVPADVTSVIISVAQYKANTAQITTNGTTKSITTASNNGAYTDITVDTTTNKTVNVATTSSGKRIMINTITFVIPSDDSGCEHEYEETARVGATCTENGSITYTCKLGCGDFYVEPIIASGHDYEEIAREDASCTKTGSVTTECTECGDEVVKKLPKLQHTYTDGKCSVCQTTNAVFEFGANKNVTEHTESTTAISAYTETKNGQTLTLTVTTADKIYKDNWDAIGNSCLKMGTGSAVGKFSFVVPENVDEVIISASGYKATKAYLTINDVSYNTDKAFSNNGEYVDFTVDTSSNKTVTVLTTSSGYRAMINSITFVVGETTACTHENQTTDITNATYLKDGLKVVTCDDCGEELSRNVLPEATAAPVVYTPSYDAATNMLTINWTYSDDFVLDIDANTTFKLFYKLGEYEKTIDVPNTVSGSVIFEGFNAARLDDTLYFGLTATITDVDTDKFNKAAAGQVVASTLVDGDSDLGKLMAAINSATDEAAVVAGQVNNTADLVSNTMKADLKAGTLDLRFVASQDLITKLNTLGKEGRTVTLTVTIGETVTKDITIDTLKKVTMVKITGMSFEQFNSIVTVKLGFDYADNANNFETDVVEFNCGEIIADTDTAVANAFEAFMK